jgi:hypothetical protein
VAACHEMQKDQVWVCEACGLELKVVKTCADQVEGTCLTEPCEIECCGKALKLKES